MDAFTAFPQEKENRNTKKENRETARARASERLALFRSETGDFVSVTGAQHFASNTRQLGGYIRLIQPRLGRSTGVTST